MSYEKPWYDPSRIEMPRPKRHMNTFDTLPGLKGAVFYRGRVRRVGYRIGSFSHELSLTHVEGVRVYDGYGTGHQTLPACLAHFHAEVKARAKGGDAKAANIYQRCFG